jgi:phosphatidate cytidylyltransferase
MRRPGDETLPRPRPWADLRLRALSASVMLPAAIGCLWLGGWAWAALVTAGALGMVAEWLALCRLPILARRTLPVPFAVLTACVLTALAHVPAALIWLVLWMGLLWLRMRRPGPALCVPYVGLPAIALIWLRGDTVAGRDSVLFVLLVVWATDIAAYLAGRLVGGPRLAPSISPGKTWSGAAGGLAGALLVGWTAGFSAVPLAPGLSAVPLAAALSVVAQAGDLLESAIKRRFGVKDSGRLIPGHGGLLDRLDGILTAAPAAALLALASGRGVGFFG